MKIPCGVCPKCEAIDFCSMVGEWRVHEDFVCRTMCCTQCIYAWEEYFDFTGHNEVAPATKESTSTPSPRE